jgi:hypothetical protein
VRLSGFVMAGLVLAIHVFFAEREVDVDARHKAGMTTRRFGCQEKTGPKDRSFLINT